MSFTCPQCGKSATQPLNYCRQCGAPAPTIALSTAPLAAVTDPLDTWEPTKPVAAPAATEVLPSAPAAASQPLPARAELPTAAIPALALPAPATAVKAPRPAARRGFIAASALGLLLIIGGGYVWGKRSLSPAVAPLAVTAVVPVAEMPTAVAAPVPSPTALLPLAAPAVSLATNNSAAHAKPGAGAKADPKADPKADRKADPKANTAAMLTPAPNAAAVKSAAREVQPERAVALDNTLAARNQPAPSLSLIEQGHQLLSAGQWQEAIQLYEKARRANPGNADVYYLLGSAYQRSGELAKALEAYRQCTSGNYAAVAANHVKNLEKKLSKTNKGQAALPE